MNLIKNGYVREREGYKGLLTDFEIKKKVSLSHNLCNGGAFLVSKF